VKIDSHTIFEKSKPGRRCVLLPRCDVPQTQIDQLIPGHLLRTGLAELPEVSELELARHFIRLSHKNMGVDTAFYPLGSCTMKYNPKINERCVALTGFTQIHPYQPGSSVQGLLQLLYELERYLAEIGGMDAISLQPAAGAHGELTTLLMIKAYFKDHKEGERIEVLIPDSAHGTNPASCTMCGFRSVQVASNSSGRVDIQDLKSKVSNRTAAMMITNPNTLGLFEDQIVAISEILHEHGAFLYMDGANINAIMGITRPGDFGVDAIHYNLHKTFSTPHGGGGPGAGPIGVKRVLEPYLPIPRIIKRDGVYSLDDNYPSSIGKVKSFYGNISILIRAYVYIRSLGADGLKDVAYHSVLNANYLLSRLKAYYNVPYDRYCMHEFVITPKRPKGSKIRTLDIAKRLLDFGFHPPTIYFPLIVSEALMIEPTETESKETLDGFAEAMIQISREIKDNPELLQHAPHNQPVRRLDEVKAAREPKVCFHQ
jgi:glycine dehydrogenase subunit 2